MSKHRTSGSRARPASSSAPPAPPAGPESTVSAAWAPAWAISVSPPEDCMTCGSAQPGRVRAIGQSAQIVGQQRRQGGVEHGGGGALVLAEGADELAGERDVRVGRELCEQLREQALVGGVDVGVQQRDGHGLRLGVVRSPARGRAAASAASACSTPCGPIRSGAAKRSGAGTSGAGAAWQSLYRCARAWRPSSMTSVKPAVAISAVRAVRALEQGVGGDGHAVGKARHLLRASAGARERQRHRCEHRDRLVCGRGGNLGAV